MYIRMGSSWCKNLAARSKSLSVAPDPNSNKVWSETPAHSIHKNITQKRK